MQWKGVFGGADFRSGVRLSQLSSVLAVDASEGQCRAAPCSVKFQTASEGYSRVLISDLLINSIWGNMIAIN